MSDARTGLLQAVLLDGGWLTELRTGAAGAVVAKHLARRDIETAGVIGAGAQGRANGQLTTARRGSQEPEARHVRDRCHQKEADRCHQDEKRWADLGGRGLACRNGRNARLALRAKDCHRDQPWIGRLARQTAGFLGELTRLRIRLEAGDR